MISFRVRQLSVLLHCFGALGPMSILLAGPSGYLFSEDLVVASDYITAGIATPCLTASFLVLIGFSQSPATF